MRLPKESLIQVGKIRVDAGADRHWLVEDLIRLLREKLSIVPEQYRNIATVSFKTEIDDVLGDRGIICYDTYLCIDYTVLPHKPKECE